MRGRPPKQHIRPSRTVWVDAQDWPEAHLKSLFVVAERRRTVMTLVSYRSLNKPDSAFIRGVVLSPEFQSVAARISSNLQGSDVVLTGDPQLSATARGRGAQVLAPGDSQAVSARLDQMLLPPPVAEPPKAVASQDLF